MIELKPREYKKLGIEIDSLIKVVIENDYGLYEITEEQAKLFKIMEGMVFLQEHINKGIKLHGWEGKERRVEIYDYAERQRKIENSLKGFKL